MALTINSSCSCTIKFPGNRNRVLVPEKAISLLLPPKLGNILHYYSRPPQPKLGFISNPSSPTTPQPLTSSQLRFHTSTASTLRCGALPGNTTVAPDESIATSTCWSEFARNVSGEWDGFGADFTAEGTPIELPESVVPEAFREWEVKVLDWQTQCPTLAAPDHTLLSYKTIKLLPTVGCEADAATRHSIDERSVGGADQDQDQDHKVVDAFAYQASGCYVAVWPGGDKKKPLLEVEHCLINPKDRESRVRVIQVVGVVEGDDEGVQLQLQLQGIRVFCEQWYGPFRNGDQLGGCAIRDSAFAATPPLEPSLVARVLWQGPISVATFDSPQHQHHQQHEGFLRELLDDGIQKTVRDESDLVLLPKQLWCSLKQIQDGEIRCEVGWVFDQGSAVTSSCIFSPNAKLKASSLNV
ncbi:hypothetical protein Tsubulata_014642 [Turnera subulata]|uniref:Uncharacterized protein n=1 Tax=Turnera subulata TaxID=218843 RepID=A0A9Q0JM40_9ROSI|nr:hypothetical protein Tsubulata_014642 [Turnera subulata]